MTTPSFKGGQERMGPPSFELKVPFAALEWIADVGLVDIRPASPLGFLLTGARTYSPQQRHEAGRQFCRMASSDRAGTNRPAGVGSIDSKVQNALSVLGNPSRRIRVASVDQGAPACLLTFYLNDADAVYAVAAEDGMTIGPVVPVVGLRQRLLAAFYGVPPSKDLAMGVITASAFRAIRLLWNVCGFSAHQDVLQSRVEHGLIARGYTPSEAADLCGSLVHSGVIELHDGAFRLNGSWRDWARVLASETLLEVESVSLLGTGTRDLGSIGGRAKKALLIGPPGTRAYCSFTSADFLSKQAPSEQGRAEPLVVLRYLTPTLSELAVDDLLGLTVTQNRPVVNSAAPPSPQPKMGGPEKVPEGQKEAKDAIASGPSCPKCGAPLARARKFCTKCRHQLS